jgi:hypothetical protein
MAFSAEVLKTLKPEDLSEILPQIQDGDILLCSTTNMFARLIRWSTKSPWSHVAIVYKWPNVDRFCVFECVQRSGVRMVPLERFISQGSSGKRPFPGKIVLARHADLSEKSDLIPLADFAIDCLGDLFSPAEITKIGIRIIFGRLLPHTPKSFTSNNKYICSEYVFECLKKIHIQIKWDGLGFIAPADFARDPNIQAIAQFKIPQP